MGKKAKKKAKNSSHKEKRVSSGSPQTVPQYSNPADEIRHDEDAVIKERKGCTHIEKGVNLEKISSKIGSSEHVKCEDCREGALDRKAGKGKRKHGKKKGASSMEATPEKKSIWVCLDCGHFACGGIGLPTTPQSHAIRHARSMGHHCVIQYDNPHLRWCFPCESLIPVEKSEENGKQKDILLDVVKLIKGRSVKVSMHDVEDVWFGNGADKIKLDDAQSQLIDGKGAYTVRGLVNLGNTCFFNSVMQNLFSMDMLRDYFMKLDQSVGPLTMSLKKLFSETSLDVDPRNVLNPKALFGCICSKSPQFRGYQQQDSHELLRCLLDGLCTEELSVRKLRNSSGRDATTSTSNQGSTFIDMIFGGQLSSTVCCLECGHSSIVFEPFLDLSLPVPTKKPPSKKATPVSHRRKTKLPMKKGRKVRVKGNTDATTQLVQSELSPSESRPDEASHDLDLNSQNLDVSAIQDAENSKVFQNVEEQTSASLDQLSWLDYIDPVKAPADNNLVSQDYDISVVQDSENQQVIQSGIPQNGSDSQSWACSTNGESKLEHSSSQSNPCEDELPLQIQGSEVLLLPYKEDNSNNEEMMRRETETFTCVAGCEQDTLEFDGFGDLFNEPEMPAVTNAESWLCDSNFQFQASEVTDSSFLAANSSDSGPDEVDNTDAPVSIGSCLAYFTKPELLTKEHAWHCERCSKILRGQRREYRENLQQTASRTGEKAAKLRRKNSPFGSDDDSLNPVNYRHLGNGKLEGNNVSTTTTECLILHTEKPDDSKPKCTNCTNNQMGKEVYSGLVEPTCSSPVDHPQISPRDKGIGKLEHASRESSPSSGHCKSISQMSFGAQTTDSSSPDESTNMVHNADKTQPPISQLMTSDKELDDSADEEMDSENVKVKRDATKRILINRAPPILTIHLKRFSQDARGRLSKLNGHVHFRDVIDLRPYMDPRCGGERCDYSLVGVVEHSGTMRGGHYVAYVRGRKGRGKTNNGDGEYTWYYASDAYVREVTLAEVLQSEAYILFYEKL
uniref:ubiquitinyl hydrolase 1 n=1 Tax=Nelumbo nucifera TaxID=4432 RepID=A0A822Z0Q3_NELNU|nr:TPA_asm: hypothetical protein HUJ06_007710 [Nelumbo nucifera]